MTRTLHNRLDISSDLSLPLDVVTGTEAILATKGMGKTHLAQVLAEELLDHDQVFIAIDPTDAWWGLRSSADGKHDGYQVTIFGGRHADMKLDPNAGIQIADLVIAGHSVVVCTRGLEDDQEVAIVTAIMKRLYRKNREPRKIFLDEADMFAPERLRTKGQAESLGAVANIVKRGRNSGLGITLITQRSASISKDVLNLCDTLFVLGMESPLDIEPIDRWIRTKDPKKAELATELVDSLPVLQRGDAWAWNSRANLHKQFRARPKRTFDSGGTPKVGQRKRIASRLARIDLEKLGEEIAQQVAAQRADDPAALREDLRKAQLEIKWLGIQLEAKTGAYDQMQKAASAAQLKAAKPTKMIEPKKLDKLTERAEKAVGRFRDTLDALGENRLEVQAIAEQWKAEVVRIRGELKQPAADSNGIVWSPTAPPRRAESKPTPAPAPAPAITERDPKPDNGKPDKDHASTSDGKPTKMARKFLTVLAQHGAKTRDKLRVLADYRDSGPVSACWREMKRLGWMVEESGMFVITTAGVAALGAYELLPSGPELLDYYLGAGKLPGNEQKMLAVLRAEHPKRLTRPELRDRAGYKDSGPTSAAMRHLIDINLVINHGSELGLAEELVG